MNKPEQKDQVLKTMLDTGIVAVMRADSSEQLVDAAMALCEGGVKAIEVTMTTPNAIEVIGEVSKKMKKDGVAVGVGTCLDPETCRAAILAGAQFVVAPCLNLDVIKLCRRYSVVCVPGAYTPTEILTAWEAGADIVKVFPADTLGPQFFKGVLAPLPQVRLSPTGGVSLDTVEDFIKAGACCVAAGGKLVPKAALNAKDWAQITDIARQFIQKIQHARGQ
ncbi:bifunctional 4-hydroxy-2-oxoglutarate aldolase/2-dehydro-3-deoxy-phosphogluconate aldolase [bacterium]|nr:bifunctional 4-hydroxy-2-oxoglutarate aldolase/2-dehydro-3-deoxy-phosphogluconate aldolase [bacterium]